MRGGPLNAAQLLAIPVFMLARAADFHAAEQIVEVCDRDLLQDLSRRLIAPTAMDVIARALTALGVRRNFAMAGVGFIVVVHVVMVALVPRTFPSMFTGRIRRSA